MVTNFPNLTKDKQEKAKQEKDFWAEKAVYWHNSIPNFDYNMRNSLTKDTNLIFNFKQLELNEDLHNSVKLNNYINIALGVINLIFAFVNIYLFLH